MAFDEIAYSLAKQAKDQTDSKIQPYTFVATSTTSTINHNFDYSPTTDKLIIYCNGLLLNQDNYTDNSDKKGITLTGWTIPSGYVVDFILYKNVI
jgi:hypothetical protein